MSFATRAVSFQKIMASKSLGNMKYLSLVKTSKSILEPAKRFSTFKHEMSLPHLPVPALNQTMDKYLTSMKPLLSENEFEYTKSVVEDFSKPGGVGEQLQEILISRSHKMENWIVDWWDEAAYFKYDKPVVFYSSPGIAFPKQNFHSVNDQLRYCAKAIRAVLTFKSLVDSESLPVDMLRNEPQTMVQYCRILSSTRMPDPVIDSNISVSSHESKHITVMCNDQAFEMDVYKGNNFLSEAELFNDLHTIAKMAEDSKQHLPIGVLTTSDRRTWGKNYEQLRNDAVNRKSLDRIIKSVFVLCLDKPHVHSSNDAAVCEDPIMSVTVNQVLHGGGSQLNSCNRWFDKIFQLIVSEDGHVGCCYEHSSAEATPVQALCNHIISRCSLEDTDSLSKTSKTRQPTRLQWTFTEDLAAKIRTASACIDELVNDTDMRFIRYRGCGKNVPKANKMSPDAFIQIGLQLAYYRLHGHIPPTYETASTKKFRLGRTDTIRTASLAVKAFCQSMMSKDRNMLENRDLLLKAIESHTKYTKEASNGQGIDRHLLGLKMASMKYGIELHDFFHDKAYDYGFYHKLATSQVPSPFGTVVCYGPSVPDGYGVCYNPQEDCINFAVSTMNSASETSSARFADALRHSFDDLQKLLLKLKL